MEKNKKYCPMFYYVKYVLLKKTVLWIEDIIVCHVYDVVIPKKKLRNIIVVYKVIKIHFNLLIFCLRYKAVQLSKHIRCDGCYQIDGRLLFMCAINGWIFIILSVLELFFLMNWFVLIVKTFFFASLSCWIIFFWNITYRTRV